MSTQLPIRFLDLRVTEADESEELSKAFAQHLKTGKFLISDTHEPFEEEFAKSINRKYCVGLNTGTDALVIGLRLLNLPKGSHVITTPFSWIASSTSIILAGLRPVFLDIGEDLQLDLNYAEDFLRKSDLDISAILIPHLHGNVSSLSKLSSLRRSFGVRIIEDCAQAYGAYDSSGVLAGTIGDVSAFSFNPMKVLGALGDAGAVVFDEEKYLPVARSLRHSGMIGTIGSVSNISWNCRIDALQASFLLIRLRYFKKHLQMRRRICEIYNEGLSDIVKPVTQAINYSNHYCYQVLCDNRDQLAGYLQAKGIESRIRHNFLIPDHPALVFGRTNLPTARRLLSRILCLPMHHQMSESDANYVVSHVREFYRLGT